MKKEDKSKLKYNVIICFIGTTISLGCFILELVLIQKVSIFWIILLICNLLILLGSYYEYKKM